MIRHQTKQAQRMRELARRITEATEKLTYYGSLAQTKPVVKTILANERAILKAASELNMIMVTRLTARGVIGVEVTELFKGPRKPARKRQVSSMNDIADAILGKRGD